MFCTTCGTPLPEGTRFCTTCGASAYFAPAPIPAPTPTPVTNDLPSFNPIQNVGNVPPSFPAFNEPQPMAAPVIPQPIATKKADYEYKVVTGVSLNEVEAKLNEYAAEGWRVVSVNYGLKEAIILERKI